jgi:hypothetical protein
MPKCLTPAQIEQYREEGCVFPIRIMSETEAAALQGRLDTPSGLSVGPTPDFKIKTLSIRVLLSRRYER